MRRRVLAATVSALAVAVIMLGIPLAVAVVQIIRDDALRDLESRASTAARALDVRYQSGESITEENVNSFVSRTPGSPSYIQVTLPDGTVVTGGEEPSPAYSESYATESGIRVLAYISWWDVFWQGARMIALVVASGTVAIVAGIAMAVWQANRLAAPLVYLAASAEQLGSGQVRPRLEATGIEEIDMVADELARSADRMAARLATERQFAADASHQLRTPLTALTMRLEEITFMTDQAEVREEAERSLEQVERLVGVVDELLGRSRRALGSGTELVQLDEVFEQQREEWSGPFHQAGRTLVIEPTHSTVFATPGGLAQVLATLIENSLKHGGGVTRVVARESGQNHAVVIEVGDQGDGVPEDLAGRIFEREVTSGKGTGLGLALARDLVTADGGRLELAQRVPAMFAVFLQGVPRMVDLEEIVPHGRAVDPRRRRR
ncbi:ATP-binding protein [Demequina lignilytica]|uniref:Signal transduction histidine-protein kinase/phosphatase MprB n=1 Tax=Demequina lignilytica TaxID=3051663 RepID=A0AAW7M3U5_9MICO|nr:MULTISPECIES: ATP-binding protein [unclassified Demequina]MDN4478258.1 ATP-binding protein [Demequina sp. SYSU T00039-1]MDN4482666.1 ATP-binding protein [Demequina sp. SYSU T0a273]MDN4488292.1 ATP-binding protein [Demequina sp. SYSU T00039]MDN4490161.1 ATP-binding protein [Demequina sp. SYSU T00068]